MTQPPTHPGPMGYEARPATMAALVTALVQDRLFEHGVKYARIGLMAAQVEEMVAPELEDTNPRPADEALRLALDVVEKAWDTAMDFHGMYRASIDQCLRKVRDEAEEAMREHIRIRRQAPEGVRGPLPLRGCRPAYARMRVSGADPIPRREDSP